MPPARGGTPPSGSNRRGECSYCEGLSMRSCLDVLSVVLGSSGSVDRVSAIESAFAGGGDACAGLDLESCVEHYDALLVSTSRTARLGRLRAACSGGLLPSFSPGDLLVTNATALGGWSVGVAGFEPIACAACHGAPCIATKTSQDVAATVTRGARSPYASTAFRAACAAVDRDGEEAYLRDADDAIQVACTACSDETTCATDIRRALASARLEDRLSVLEVAFAGADVCDGASASAPACAEKLDSLLFESLDVPTRDAALLRACRAAQRARALAAGQSSSSWGDFLLQGPHRNTSSMRGCEDSACQQMVAARLALFVLLAVGLMWLIRSVYSTRVRGGYARVPTKEQEDNVPIAHAIPFKVQGETFQAEQVA
ncbi:hypothetical protein CTAYLR_005450 [Chrysophaeum taylorii]|uniref:Uncharacterized protein n=1 Tax=Chrysophaeum taylorii TaxID=2483200 RepID=A0AAD7UK86_9STRA|nr:hypothetical protein CTAYLR_005450 [Chrysophaeum taylorii]